jgi:hypothetical protein
MRKILSFGKVDFNNTGKKINEVEIEVNYNNDRLSICGSVWNSKKTDIIAGGQCLDEIKPYLNNDKKFNYIYLLWKKYHLNDMKAGSPLQQAFIDELELEHYDYEIICKELENAGLLLDESFIYNDKPYHYGSAWLFSPIPNEIKNYIQTI